MSVNLHKSERIAVIGHDLIGAISGIELYRNSRVTPTVILEGDVPEDIDVIGVTGMSKIMTPGMAYRQPARRRKADRCLVYPHRAPGVSALKSVVSMPRSNSLTTGSAGWSR